eukprot:SAG31_NODE_3819_length_3852_cov_8.593658_2_plen_61_part_00
MIQSRLRGAIARRSTAVRHDSIPVAGGLGPRMLVLPNFVRCARLCSCFLTGCFRACDKLQ